LKIKRLEIVGFKSFSDRTVVEFKEGITGIVGPNGCGKSNIVDAIRWVMGEMSAKHLRGKSMEDVIFAGTEKRTPTGMAEVTLVFSADGGGVPLNFAEFSEIAVRRRLYRSGESEYAINGVPCRLKDVHDLFLGTGVGVKAYSIIEQGRIGQVIGAKSEERRLILEEAAGISKFKSRKEAALRKIEATRGNLLRLEDILAELDRQIRSLDRQARKAERYREIEQSLRETELHLASLDFLRENAASVRTEAELKGLEEQEAALAAKVSEFENRVEADRVALLEKDQEYRRLQEEIYEKNNSLQLHQAEIEYKTREIDSLAEQNETASREIEVVKDRIRRLDSTLHEINEQQVGIDLELAQTQENFSGVQARLDSSLLQEKTALQTLEDLNQDYFGLLKDHSDQQSRKEAQARRKVDLKGRIGRDQGEIDEIDRLLVAHGAKTKELEGNLSEVKQLKLDLTQQKENIAESLVQQKENLVQAEAQLGQLKDELALRISRLQSLEELEKNFEGYQEGVRQLMVKKRATWQDGHILGTVAEMVETDSSYEHAVSAALGEKLQYVVVKNQEVGLEALQYAKSQSTGRLSCIPMELRCDGGDSPLPYSEGDGVLGPLKNFVQLKGPMDRVGDYLFADVYLVESLNKALQLWNQNGHQKTLVTMDGEVVDPSGVVSGGSLKNSSQDLLEKRREIKELRGEVRVAEARWRQKKDEVESIKGRIVNLEHSLQSLTRDGHSEEIKLVHQEQDLQHLKVERARFFERRDKLCLEISVAMQEESDIDQEIQGLEQSLAGLEERKNQIQGRMNDCKAQIEQTKAQLESLRHGLLEAQAVLTRVQEKRAGFERDLGRLGEEKIETQQTREARIQTITLSNSKILQLKKEIEESRLRITQLVSDLQTREQSSNDLKEKVGQLQGLLQNCETDLRQDRQRLEGVRQGLQAKIRVLSEARTVVQVLREQILERYHVDLAEIAPQYRDKPIDRELEEPRARELREKLEKIGPVNLGAIEEYQELKGRHEFLHKQHQDLEQSLDALLRALQKVNRTTKARLVETYEKVNLLFQEVFPKLFKGGKAELRLTDPENILESGVEIIAQPPGKKLQSVALMSGGEKALTAISLVFAIFLLKPSPFCLLDEVDAPLDDVNIGRFNDMVRSLVDRSQFILITHNKQTMEMADVLYGITMEQAGISKMVSVDLHRN
jgi:chromosome segregation protein